MYMIFSTKSQEVGFDLSHIFLLNFRKQIIGQNTNSFKEVETIEVHML